jgi:predicted nucleic acid-binding protein
VTLVVDASAVVEFVLGSTQGRNAAIVMAAHTTLHAPALITAEALSALGALERRADISPARSAEAVSDLLSVPIRRYPTEPLAGRIWSMRHTVTVYDAHYVALAEVLNAPLLTGDHRLAAAAGEVVEIHLT